MARSRFSPLSAAPSLLLVLLLAEQYHAHQAHLIQPDQERPPQAHAVRGRGSLDEHGEAITPLPSLSSFSFSSSSSRECRNPVERDRSESVVCGVGETIDENETGSETENYYEGDSQGTEQQQQQHLHLHPRQENPSSSSSSSISIPQTAANGGITMTQPPITAQATFYKIASDNYITFGWSFTDVLVTPTALTINAYCSQNGYTYPVGPTSGIPGDSTQFAWNPYEYEQSAGATPLAEASYTLRIFDERGYYAAPSGGYMSPYIGTIFALYRPQKYVALADGWTCTACSAALRATHIHPAVLATAAAFLLGTMTVFLRL